MKTVTEYSAFVSSKLKPGSIIAEEMTSQKAHLNHMAMGVSGEAGELLDAIKVHVMYNKPLDLENVREELGDLEFYMEGIRSALNIDRGDTIVENMEKLDKRYPGKYTDEHAQQRLDKVNKDA